MRAAMEGRGICSAASPWGCAAWTDGPKEGEWGEVGGKQQRDRDGTRGGAGGGTKPQGTGGWHWAARGRFAAPTSRAAAGRRRGRSNLAATRSREREHSRGLPHSCCRSSIPAWRLCPSHPSPLPPLQPLLGLCSLAVPLGCAAQCRPAVQGRALGSEGGGRWLG